MSWIDNGAQPDDNPLPAFRDPLTRLQECEERLTVLERALLSLQKARDRLMLDDATGKWGEVREVKLTSKPYE